ncbi:DUF4360 domain-containing protein [Polyangium sp. 15x6]|uniref:DUF4360 domain-containing protein n=1 Tax=Polyangium sp. 15x6 TaxID=3042687 RepID=UPI00249AB629|nr:DUF4360 domain-containing protein [Polyangium sp. 15x6]MDI3282268.1 DUF4360 domain-containing protein [Polyangium sp. 15x6]
MKARFMGLLVTMATMGLGVAGSPGVATAQPEVPEFVRIRNIQYSGPACPQGSANVSTFANNTAFLVTYNEFLVEAAPGFPPSQGNKQCTLSIEVEHPPGWSYTIGSIVYRGNAVLGRNVSARFRARYNFPGTASSSNEVFMSGPTNSDFELPKDFSLEVWEPRCTGGALPIIVTGTAAIDTTREPQGTGIIRVEQTDGTFDMIINLRWRRC